MRVLGTQKIRERKDKVLNWVVFTYARTGKPVSSEVIARGGGMDISSATVRNILKNLEDEGYLEQLHTSGGRIPTDKGYRKYVDNILEIERDIISEKEMIEQAYADKIEQLDAMLKNTSKVIADLSKWAGLVFFGDLEGDALRRVDFSFITPKNVLIIIVTHSGVVRHFGVSLREEIRKKTLLQLADELNRKIKDLPLSEVGDAIWREFISASELSPAESEIFKKIYSYFTHLGEDEEEIYMDGLMKISEHLDESNIEDFRNIMRIMDDKKRFAHMLKERLKDAMSKHQARAGENKCRDISVVIGAESQMKEFGNFSLVSSAYCVNDKAIGLVGVLGHKRMEYPRIISIVDAVSSTMEDIMAEWENLGDDYE